VLWIAATAALSPSAAAADPLVLALTDARDCPLIGVSVVARNTASGVEYKKKSDGGTLALDVPAGTYAVSVSRPGFDDRTESVRVPAATPRKISLRRKRLIVITSPSEPGVDWTKMYFTGVVRESTNADRIVSNIRVIITPAGDRTKQDSTTTDVEGQFWFNVPEWRELDVHLGDHAEYAAVSPAVEALRQPTQCQVLPLEVDRIDALSPQQLPRAISALDNISLFDMEPEAMRSAVEALRARDLSLAGPAAAQQLAAVQLRVDAQVMELRRSASMAADYSRLMSMTPGVIRIGVNGAESRFNHVLIDGAVATDLSALSAPRPIVTLTPPGPPAGTPATLFERAPAADVDQPGLAETILARRSIGGRWLFDAAAFGTAQSLTSQPVKLTCFCAQGTTGFGTVDFHDATATTGGSVVPGRLSVSATFVSRDASAVQPGADGTQNATKRQVLERLTWNVRGAWFITQSYSDGIRTVGDAPTIAQPFLTLVTYSQRTPTLSATVRRQTGADTLWEAVGSTAIGAYARGTPDSATDAPWRHDLQTGRSIGGSYGAGFAARADDRLRTRFARTLGTAVVHRFMAGAEYARSTEHGTWIVPGGVYRFTLGTPLFDERIDPSQSASESRRVAAYAQDSATFGRLSLVLGLRYDAITTASPALRPIDTNGQVSGAEVQGLGDISDTRGLSPRASVTLHAAPRLNLFASFGRYYGVIDPRLTAAVHPASGSDTLGALTASRAIVVDPRRNIVVNANLTAPNSDVVEASAELRLTRRWYIRGGYSRTDERDAVGWRDIAGRYQTLSNSVGGNVVPLFSLLSDPADRRFELGNPDGWGATRQAFNVAVNARWATASVSGAYSRSRYEGLTLASGVRQGAPTLSYESIQTFGRDPNDLVHASGLLPSDRTHLLTLQAQTVVPRVTVTVTGLFRYETGQPLPVFAYFGLAQGARRVLVEPLGETRLPASSLLDLSASKRFAVGRARDVTLIATVYNVLNETAPDGVITGNAGTGNFARGDHFRDPRRLVGGFRVGF